MSNYMSIPNQQILWNTVNRIPAFMQLPLPKRELEFKTITEYFYREHMTNTPILSTIQLQELNRKTILAFLPSTSASLVSRERPPLPPSTLSPSVSESNIVETRQEKQERAFLERQNMYAQMTEKPNLPSPEMFKEKETDEKITNMDELIASYQKQRNLEIPIIPPPNPNPTPTQVPSIPSTKKKNITFLEETEINSLEIEDLSTEGMSAEGALKDGSEKKNLALNDGSEKKNLAWNINLEETRVIEDSYLQELEKRIVSLEKQIQFLSERKKERKSEEKEIQTISESEVEVERKKIEEIIESVILSIEQHV